MFARTAQTSQNIEDAQKLSRTMDLLAQCVGTLSSAISKVGPPDVASACAAIFEMHDMGYSASSSHQ